MRWRLVLSALALLIPSAASAQSAPISSGPMTVERMHNGFAATADVKVTKINRRTSELVGGQAGWIFDDALFVGGGGYWLANGSRDREMAYGGLVVQWLAHADHRVNFGARALVGGGQATLAQNVTIPIAITAFDLRGVPGRALTSIADALRNATVNRTTSVRFREDFFVFEPEATASLRLVSHLRLTGGVGYRLTSTQDRIDDRLRGATGSIGLQVF